MLATGLGCACRLVCADGRRQQDERGAALVDIAIVAGEQIKQGATNPPNPPAESSVAEDCLAGAVDLGPAVEAAEPGIQLRQRQLPAVARELAKERPRGAALLVGRRPGKSASISASQSSKAEVFVGGAEFEHRSARRLLVFQAVPFSRWCPDVRGAGSYCPRPGFCRLDFATGWLDGEDSCQVLEIYLPETCRKLS